MKYYQRYTLTSSKVLCTASVIYAFKTSFELKEVFNEITQHNRSAVDAKNRFYWDGDNKFWVTASAESAARAEKMLRDRGAENSLKPASSEQSFKQRKFLWKKKEGLLGNSVPEDCGCGGKFIIKDHGTWIGYFCPKCGTGGSKTKNNKR